MEYPIIDLAFLVVSPLIKQEIYSYLIRQSPIQKFDSNDKFHNKWGSQGTGDSQFKNPTEIATDLAGNVYVLDTGK